MGGRGTSYGISNKGNKYGTQYKTLLQVGNIKFVSKNTRTSEPLMETMTKGRVYVEVGGKDLLRIISFDSNNKRNRVIERDKRSGEWHLHKGYFHSEYGKEKHEPLTASDRAIVDRIKKLWQNKK